MTFIANAAHLAADANGALAAPAGKLRGALRRLFASDWTERWMIVVNEHAVGTLARDAEGLQLSWFEREPSALSQLSPLIGMSLTELHRHIALTLNVEPRRVVFLPIGE
jgi:hypothetical protein